MKWILSPWKNLKIQNEKILKLWKSSERLGMKFWSDQSGSERNKKPFPTESNVIDSIHRFLALNNEQIGFLLPNHPFRWLNCLKNWEDCVFSRTYVHHSTKFHLNYSCNISLSQIKYVFRVLRAATVSRDMPDIQPAFSSSRSPKWPCPRRK